MPKAGGDDAEGGAREYRSGVEDVITLFRPTGPRELQLVAASGYRRWPPRLPEQSIFDPVTNETCAREIAERWNGAGFVTRFAVKREFLERYERKVAGEHEEYRIPAEDLEALNDAIVGRIEVAGAFGELGDGCPVEALLLPDSRIEFGGERPELPANLDDLDLVEAACTAAAYVSSISEDYWCAGWLMGIGADSYRWTQTTAPVPCGLGTIGEADHAALTRLRRRLAPWWVEWVDALGGVALIRAASVATG